MLAGALPAGACRESWTPPGSQDRWANCPRAILQRRPLARRAAQTERIACRRGLTIRTTAPLNSAKGLWPILGAESFPINGRPEYGAAVAAACEQRFASRRENDRRHLLRVLLEVQDFLAGRRIPQLDRIVLAACHRAACHLG